METYRFEQIKPNIENLNRSFIEFLSDNKITPEWIKAITTKKAYDNSDFTSWHLFYGDKKEQMEFAKDLLSSFVYKDKPVFNISGNGWNTGLSIMLTLSSRFD